MGHARAIELIYRGLDEAFTEARLFELYKAVQSEFIADIYKLYGAWKVESNGTYAVTEDGRQTFIEYAAPEDVPVLMNKWLTELNQLAAANLPVTAAVNAYAKLHLGFMHIHPFWEGNGRMARLLSNIPVLRAGHLPVVIDVKDRKAYIDTLAKYELTIGHLTRTTGVWPKDTPMAAFREFCQRAYRSTRQLIEQAKVQQALRNSNRR